MTYNTTGIILKYRDVGEFDRIYNILTREHGKVDAWAQGVRKPKSKLVAHLQPLYVCDFMMARGRRFDRIAQVRVQNRHAALWSDLEKLSKALYATSLTDTVLKPGTKEGMIFELLESTMELLEKGGGILELMFTLKLVKEAGFAPELRWCVLCKKEVVGLSRAFDAIRGGVLCLECYKKAGSESFLVSSLTLETLESIMVSPLFHLEMPETIVGELNQIAKAMIEAHFGQEPKAGIFMQALAQSPLNIV